MRWKTKLTELLKCKYPVMQGAYHGIGNWEFAAAVSKTGAVGCLTASVSKTPDKLQEDIRNIKKATQNPFMVNISIGMFPNQEDMLKVCIQENVPAVETSAFKPDKFARMIKDSGIPWIHKAATVDFLKHAEELGADALVLVGLDGYGFKSIRQLPTFTGIPWAARQLNKPLIAAGGIGDSRSMLGALLAGAEGVYIGTALMATKECPISDRIKDNIIKARPDHPDLIRELLAPPKPEDYKEVMEMKGKAPLDKWLAALEKVMLKHDDWKDASLVDQIEEMSSVGARPKGPFSFACGFIDRIVTVQEFIEDIVKGAEDILKNKIQEWELGS